MVVVSSASRVVFPEVGVTKGEVVAYYDRIGARMLAHVAGRPLSLKRYPRGLGGAGFFQKNAPAHYPASIGRIQVARSAEATKKHPRRSDGDPGVTTYPVVAEAEHLPYLANQGAIELHVGPARAADLDHPDRLIVDLDPPADGLARVRRAAHVTRDALAALGLASAPVATGSRGYHVVVPLAPTVDAAALALAAHQLATLMAAAHPDDLTVAFRVARRGPRVFLDWLRNDPGATVVAPYSLRATPRATVAAPLAWDEIETIPPDGFTIADAARLVDRPDPLAELAARPADPALFVAAVANAFADAGLVLESFDRFRS